LASVEIPNSVTRIGERAFFGCSGLTSVVIPDSVASIGEHAFSSCSELASVTIGSGVTSIGTYTFTGCDNLKDIYITNMDAWLNLPAIPHYNDSGTVLHILDAYGNELTSITTSDGLAIIKDSAFKNCSALTSAIISDGVASIGMNAFQGCSNLASIIIPDSVTSIGGYAFRDCTKLDSILIPVSVTNIGYCAFENTRIVKMNYGGTMAQWNALVNNSSIDWAGNSIINDVICTDGTVKV
jgi:hypothetical protein